MVKSKLVFACLILVYVLCSCASRGLRIEKDYDMSEHHGKSIVIGKIEARLSGGFNWPTSNAFHLIDLSTRKEIAAQKFSRGEHFFIALGPGEYNIRELELGYGISGALGLTAHLVPVDKTFTVGPDEVIYIGKLAVEYTADETYKVVDAQVAISDEHDIAAEEFRKLYPNLKKDVRKNLLR